MDDLTVCFEYRILDDNSFSELPPLSGLKLLELLYVSYMFPSLDVDSGCRSFFDNDVREIPDQIGELSSLKALIAGRNKMTEIPEAVFDMSKLEWLHFSDARFFSGSFPTQIGKLTALTQLYVVTMNKAKCCIFS